MFIMSCDKFSDLWEGHVKCLNNHWEKRGFEAYIVSETIDCDYDKVKGFAANYPSWSERLKAALLNCNTKYVIITLDDYFLVEDFNDERLRYLISVVEQNNLDYLRLFKRPTKATVKSVKYGHKLYGINTKVGYSVNLYTGIWKKDFLYKMITEPRNPWQFEVELARKANRCSCKAAVDCNKNDFRILDVVRKGKLLRNASKYFKKNPGLYNGTRATNTIGMEFQLSCKEFVGRHAPNFIKKIIKNKMRKKGYVFYSDFDKEEKI